ncbi:hypothetical protein DFQ26_003439 [Actinomortierella ambigua]|nr:hypothetical protein DFQ26_003439 [Actinomortierella ambigua]
MPDTDDIWGDGDSQSDNDIGYERDIAEREWARMHENFGNEGYREGIEEGKDDHTMQQGFNRGWQDGFHYGHELGKLRGLISPLVEYVESQPVGADSKQFATAADKEKWIQEAKTMLRDLGAIEIENVYDKDYFDDKRSDGPVPVSPPSPTSKVAVASDNNKASGSCSKSGAEDNGGGCCQSKSARDASDKNMNGCQQGGAGRVDGGSTTDEAESGCCQSKTVTNGSRGSGGCCKSTTTTTTTTVAQTSLSSAMSDTVPEGSEYSKPEAVVKIFRDRAARLLQQANLGHLVTI